MSISFSGNRGWLAAGTVAVAISVAGFTGVWADHVWAASATNAVTSDAGVRHGYSSVVKRVVPAVVNISSSKTVKQDPELGLDPFFRQFFGNGNARGNGPSERRE